MIAPVPAKQRPAPTGHRSGGRTTHVAWNRINTLLLALVLLVLAGALARGVLGGPLDPPAPPGSTMKTLAEVEPRTPLFQPASAAGFPIVISQPGAYYLAGDITGVAGKGGIEISAHDVTIDLNGFALNGVASSSIGIYSSGWNTTVENGGISNWGAQGALMMAPNSHFVRVQARSNGVAGIQTSGGIIESSMATNNTGDGILFSGDGLVQSVYVATNTSHGIEAYGAVIIEQGEFVSNGGAAIKVASNATVRNNTLTNNTGGGVYVLATMNRVEGNSANGNPPIVTIPFGIRVTGTGNIIVRNTARNNLDNFDIAPGNTAGPEETGVATGPWSNVNY